MGQHIKYTAEELSWIKSNSKSHRGETCRKFAAQFSRDDVSLSNFNALCKRRGWMTGRTGCFKKGQQAHNKGKRHPAKGRSSQTQFKRGGVPSNAVPLWTERLGRDGYIEMKVPQENPHTGHSTRFLHKHRWNWEAVNGPLELGHCLKSLDGIKTNTDAANWISVPRALLPRLNGRFGRDYDAAPDDLKPTILATVKLEYAAREAKKESTNA